MSIRLVVGASTKNENILWATRFYASDAFIFLDLDGKKVMVASQLEYGRAQKQARVDEVILANDLRPQGEPISDKNDTLALLNRCNVSAVTVESNFPADMYKFLSEHGITVELSDQLFPERAIKDSGEIEDITYAQRSMEEVFPLLVDVVANTKICGGKLWSQGEWLTSEKLRLMFDVELMKRDCLCDATIIASGAQAADPHCLGFGPIVADTPIVFDMFPRSRKRWYWSDMTRTIVKGRLSDDARKMYHAVYGAQLRALDMVRPGVDAKDIHAFVASFFESNGFPKKQVNGVWEGFFHATGHGVGLQIHEWPRVGITKDQILKPGHVITIEPGLYYPSIGGVRIEDTLMVTEGGYCNLALLPKTLLELP